MLSHRFLAVTTTSVSTNTEFQDAINDCDTGTTCEIEVVVSDYQNAIDNCASDTNCEIEISDYPISITSTLDVVGKTLIIKGTQPDGSRAVLDGGRKDGSGGTTVLTVNRDSTVTIDGVAIKNGYAVSTQKRMREPHQQCHSACLHPLTHPRQRVKAVFKY